ncbi:MAG: cyclic nucleotide-binding domain-containing protein [Deltaproteobacteria bacterium]|nr:cyclic nucleotide-binding domain-containing protein [Deltaproteobacteria bacterium]
MPDTTILRGSDELVTLLGGSTLFTGLAEPHLRRLAGLGTVAAYPRNAHVFQEGEPGQELFVVLKGAVRISRQVPGMGEEALAVLRPGAAFGEMALIDASPRSADALAHEACELYVLAKPELDDLLFVDRDFACDLLWKLVRTLSTRLRETNDKMTMLSISAKFE